MARAAPLGGPGACAGRREVRPGAYATRKRHENARAASRPAEWGCHRAMLEHPGQARGWRSLSLGVRGTAVAAASCSPLCAVRSCLVLPNRFTGNDWGATLQGKRTGGEVRSWELNAYGPGGNRRRKRYTPRAPRQKGPEKNGDIRAQEVRVIGSDKENLGVMSTVKALSLASAEGLDLILVNPDGAPPVCRIMDYGKYLYEEEKKKKEARKGQSKAKSAVKELKLRPHTDVADYNVKINQAHKFLAKGNRVKVTVVFQGRDIAFKQAGADLLKRFEADVEGQGLVEGRPSSQGRQMHMLLNPTVKTTP